MYYDVGDSEALLQAVRIKIEFLAPRVVQAKFREIAKTITKRRFSIFWQFLELQKNERTGSYIFCFTQNYKHQDLLLAINNCLTVSKGIPQLY